ncbi:MAG: MarR family transcriptional regulator [Actinotalea sp.]|nr:MarR family transcriptional regulator [Actinotalea sp.]
MNGPLDELHPASGLDDVVHQRARLGILTILAEAKEADFSYLRRALDLTDGNLGRHLEVLAGADYVTVAKTYDGRRGRTWARITDRGRHALWLEVRALESLIADVRRTGEPESSDEARR